MRGNAEALASLRSRDIPILPFLKWAGGKRWLTSKYSELLDRRYTRYVEPFLGSGAVYFHLEPANALLADANKDLVDCYLAIREDWQSVHRILRRHDRNHSRPYYYQERARRRRILSERAAQFLYLNRTCWNGLYRVNLDGKFNVPIGTKESAVLNTDDFERISKLLCSATILAQDFETTIDESDEGDFVFADPPYTVRHNLNGFLKYNESIFSWEDQRRLCSALKRAKKRGVQILLLNADHNSIRNLYKGFGSSRTLSRVSVLAASPSFRGQATELAIFSNGSPS